MHQPVSRIYVGFGNGVWVAGIFVRVGGTRVLVGIEVGRRVKVAVAVRVGSAAWVFAIAV
jgi:hypothetical protein